MFWFQHYMKKCKHGRGIYVRLVALLGIPVVEYGTHGAWTPEKDAMDCLKKV